MPGPGMAPVPGEGCWAGACGAGRGAAGALCPLGDVNTGVCQDPPRFIKIHYVSSCSLCLTMFLTDQTRRLFGGCTCLTRFARLTQASEAS